MRTTCSGKVTGFHARAANARQRLEVPYTVVSAIPALTAQLANICVVALGALLVLRGQLTLGQLMSFSVLVAGFLNPIGVLVSLGGTVQQARGHLERIDDLLRYPAPQPPPVPAELPMGRLRGEVELRDVTFGYNLGKPPLLDGFSLHVQPGQRIALVGGSGSGKTTVARIITGLVTPWSGEIRFDGLPRDAVPAPVLAASLALVDQDIVLFAGTVRDNVSFLDRTLPDPAIVGAARDAAIHADISVRPGGYGAAVADGGRNFSGGQQQRIEIAPGAGHRTVDPGARRGDVLPRPGHRAGDRPGAAPPCLHHRGGRAPAVHDPRLRRDHRAGPGQGRRTRYPRRTDGPRRRLRKAGDVMSIGVECRLDAHQRLLPSADDLVVVEEGLVEVFLVSDAVPPVAPRHLGTLAAGDTLPGTGWAGPLPTGTHIALIGNGPARVRQAAGLAPLLDDTTDLQLRRAALADRLERARRPDGSLDEIQDRLTADAQRQHDAHEALAGILSRADRIVERAAVGHPAAAARAAGRRRGRRAAAGAPGRRRRRFGAPTWSCRSSPPGSGYRCGRSTSAAPGGPRTACRSSPSTPPGSRTP